MTTSLEMIQDDWAKGAMGITDYHKNMTAWASEYFGDAANSSPPRLTFACSVSDKGQVSCP
ncbi:hypothetical protein GUITHDRAFT_151757, partial [Guillardia theta CCMP2712]